MGTTLENGVYLPSEGERNCYAGLKTNWEILDQKVADVTALQQAVAGALHREIVASLPTTDIDPNTIYMILSGTSATENVYDEFMYVNNAWELIGTSATDLTNYYTKGDVDGLLLLKANASDLTSHTGDTTIHVTANDKTKWNTVALIKQLRLVNAQVGSATTIAFSDIDDTNGIKIGDKCMDLDAKMFEITAVDTTNQTVTVGSALIDLALDANVVHTSGDESISGFKTFSSPLRLTAYPSIRMYIYDDEWEVLPQTNKQSEIRFTDKNSVTVSYFAFQHRTDSNEPFRTCWRQQKMDGTNGYYSIAFNNLGNFYPENDNVINLGYSSNRWKSVYATNYYYGVDNVEFSTKFVTTDTNQTVRGSKTFSSNIVIYNSDNTANTPNLILQSSKIQLGDTTNSDNFGIIFNAGSSYVSRIAAFKDLSGTQNLQLGVRTKNSSNNLIGSMIRLRLYTNGFSSFESDGDNLVSLGSSSNKFKNVQTYKVNALEPSSLSLPSGTLADQIDISSYFTNTGTGDTNSYTASANGWIYLYVTACKTLTAYIQNATDTLYSDYRERSSDGQIRIMLPIQKNNKFTSQWITSSTVSITKAVFIPCQGNV